MLGTILNKLIEERGTSKTHLAKHLKISRSTLDDYINGKTYMPSDKIEKTAKYFNVSIAYLFGETDQTGKFVEQSMREHAAWLSELHKQANRINRKLAR